jgi:type II secretory pathway pseudopilin PulG
MKILKRQKNKGFSVIEVVIVCSILSICVFALMSSSAKSIQVSNQSLRQAQATLLIEEGVEAVKTIRDNAWTNISNLTNNTNYYLSFNNTWSLATTPNTIDGIFTRNIVFYPVYRDGDYNIASSGTLDQGIKKATVTVLFNNSSGVVSKSLSFYVSNIF